MSTPEPNTSLLTTVFTGLGLAGAAFAGAYRVVKMPLSRLTAPSNTNPENVLGVASLKSAVTAVTAPYNSVDFTETQALF